MSDMSKILCILQARMGSSRLPGKVLMPIGEVPSIQFQIDRVLRSKYINRVVVATSTLDKDDAIANYCEKNGIPYFRGSENDVLSRFYECAKGFECDTIIRLTADCPLVDPELIDKVIDLYKCEQADYASNTVPFKNSRFPDGTDCEVFSMQALETAYKEANKLPEREHVTFYIWQNEKKFKSVQLNNSENWSNYRFTVDYPEDRQAIIAIYEELRNRNQFGTCGEIVAILNEHPEIQKLNALHLPK